MDVRLCTVVICYALLFGTGSCTVGPNYIPPVVEAPTDWNTELPLGLRRDTANLSSWWTTFDDPIMTDLINRAVQDNISLRQASLRIGESRSRRAIASAGQFPTLNATATAARFQTSESLFVDLDDDLYAVGFDAAWELDLFGRVRRGVEAADAKLMASEADYRDMLVTLIAEIALNYVEIRSFQEHLSVLEANRDAQEETVKLVQANVDAGQTSRLDIEQATTSLELTRSQIPGIRTNLEQAKNRLGVLLGLQPGGLNDKLEARTEIPVPPHSIAIGVPAEALRRRSDVRRAERELAAQTAEIGVATADLYPRFRLLGSIGLDALDSGDLFSSASTAFGIGPSMRWDIFDAGRVRSNIRIQTVRQEQALLAYEQSVLSALRDVEDAIVAVGEEQIRRVNLGDAQEAARRTLSIAHDRYSMGEATFLSVLDAQRSFLSVQDQVASSNARIASYTISLYKALGGGWSSLAPETEQSDFDSTNESEDSE